MIRLELLVPPPIVMLITGVLMWAINALFPSLQAGWLHHPLVGTLIGLSGSVIAVLGVITFRRLRTTVDPRRPTASTTLATSGVYRYSRNPMYLGVLLVLVGWVFVLGNQAAVLGPIAFIAYITRYQIVPEERWLQQKFGSDFLTYKGKVRRWI